MIMKTKMASPFNQLSLDVSICRQKCKSWTSNTHKNNRVFLWIHFKDVSLDTQAHTHTPTFHGRPCHYVNHFLLEWYHLPSHKATHHVDHCAKPLLSPVTSHRVKTPWLKWHWFLFIHLLIFISIKAKKELYCLHMCVCVAIADILFAWLLHIFMPAWIRVPIISPTQVIQNNHDS